MKFGLMYEIQIRKPHYRGIEQERYRQVMAQISLADQVGFDYVWAVEHHFQPEFSHCSAPEVLYGAISQITKRIRIGHAVALLPGQYNHPIRVAERAAVLDILSDGRMDLGTGRSDTLIEMDGFQVNPEETREQWAEAVSMIPRMWTEDPFSHEGRFYKIPPRSVIPKPVQEPHPPMWMAAVQPRSFELAGQMGLGVLCLSTGGYEALKKRIDIYRKAIKNAEPIGKVVNNQVAVLCMTYCGEDDARAVEVAAPEAMWYLDKAIENFSSWKDRDVPETYKFNVSVLQKERTEKTIDDHIESGYFVIGSPKTVVRSLEKYAKVGVDQVLCMTQNGGLTHQLVMDSIKMFGRKVIPYFNA